ncbi:MAG: carbon-nitrogen hydrolase [Deltaproteobacteria bacterium]|nr:carbon-nitrogen hydrolase [Deltaproteobacteria bacterium]
MANTVTLGLVQRACSGDPRRNFSQAVEDIKKLADRGAQIISLSELFLSRYFCQVENKKFFELAERIPGDSTERLSKVAAEKKVVLVASLFEQTENKVYYNTAVVFDADGFLVGKYRKTHIPDDLTNYYGERFYFSPGDLGYKSFQTRYARIGVCVCWDQWFPEAARLLALDGAEIIFYPTAIGWPVQKKGQQSLNEKERQAWITIQRSHAIANGVFVAAVNRVGEEDHLHFWGSSFVSSPLGEVIALASDRKEELLLVPCNLAEINAVRKDWPFLKARRTDTYSRLVK